MHHERFMLLMVETTADDHANGRKDSTYTTECIQRLLIYTFYCSMYRK